jgi:hypothetical protein
MPFAPQRAKTSIRVRGQFEAIGGTISHGLPGLFAGTLTAARHRSERASIIDTRSARSRRGAGAASAGLEALHRYETYLTITLADIAGDVKAIRARGSTTSMCTAHLSHEHREEGFYQPDRQLPETLAISPQREPSRAVAAGRSPAEIFRGLKDANYRGPLVLESFAAINPIWQRQPASGAAEPAIEVLAREGLAFLRRGAEEVAPPDRPVVSRAGHRITTRRGGMLLARGFQGQVYRLR